MAAAAAATTTSRSPIHLRKRKREYSNSVDFESNKRKNPWILSIIKHFQREITDMDWHSEEEQKAALLDVEERKTILVYCVQRLSEKYMEEHRNVKREPHRQQQLQLAAFLLVWKAMGLDEIRYITVDELVNLCGGECTKKGMLQMEEYIWSMENFVVCGSKI